MIIQPQLLFPIVFLEVWYPGEAAVVRSSGCAHGIAIDLGF